MPADPSGVFHFSEAIDAFVRRLDENTSEPGRWRLPALVALEGDLGVGKTTFVKELLAKWGYAAAQVQSPTFLKLLEHAVPGVGLCLHMDCYRIEDIEDFDRLGLENYLEAAFWFVEWPEKLFEYLESRPDLARVLAFRTRLRLGFAMREDGAREVAISEIAPS